jgi:hypothetical protein
MAGFQPLQFEEAIPRLVHTYNKGKLAPFTGAGVSAPRIPGWPAFIENLSKRTDIKIDDASTLTSSELIQASEKIINQLQRGKSSSYVRAIKNSLGYKSNSEPETSPNCEALSNIWWPLVLTTNYDRMFVEAYEKKHASRDGDPIAIYGRNQRDCHTLLSSLNAPVNSLYWALQGYFGTSANNEKLEKEIVIGYRHYRQATYNNQTFRSAFGEVFRNYSLFFIGSGLSEDYFRGLFGQTLESFGSNPNTHCALFHEQDIISGKVDPHFLHTKLNIVSLYYKGEKDDYSGLTKSLADLEQAIRSESRKVYKFSFGHKNLYKVEEPSAMPDLEVFASAIPTPTKKECCIISAGFNKIVWLSHKGKAIVEGTYDAKKFQATTKPLVYQYDKGNLFAAIARNQALGTGRKSRDLRIIKDAFIQALQVTNGHFHTIHCMHLSAGSERTFPPVFSFIQMLHAFKIFASTEQVKSTVRIYVSHPSVIFYIRRNMFELEELLNCNDVKINIEIRNPEEVERYTFYARPDVKFKDVSEYFDIDARYWDTKIIPEPYKEQSIPTDASLKLDVIGIIPGSTIRYTKR